jgi:hypothetical protein
LDIRKDIKEVKDRRRKANLIFAIERLEDARKKLRDFEKNI